MSLPEKNYAQYQFINGDTGQIQDAQQVFGNIILEYDNPNIVVQAGADKFAVALPYVVFSQPTDSIFKLNNAVLAIKTFATLTGLAGYRIKQNEVGIVTNDPTLRHVVWLDKSALTKNFYYEYTTTASVFSTVYMEEIAEKLNKLNVEKIESDIIELETRATTLESRADVLEQDLLTLEVDVENINQEVETIKTDVTAITNRVASTENSINTINSELVEINSKIATNTADITELKNNVSTLQTDTEAITDRVFNNENNIEKLQEKTAGITRDELTGTTIINDKLKANSTLEVLGNASLQNTTVKDLTITGNIAGTLKDAQGFKYLKIKTGSITTWRGYSNIRVELREGGALTITGLYEEDTSQSVGGGGAFTKLNQSTPSNIVFLSLDFIIFNAVSLPLNFLAFGNPANSSNTSKYNIVYRNLTNGAENILNWQGRFIITGKVDPATLTGIVTWDA